MYQDPEVPVLEQALEDLLGNNNESSGEMSYSHSEIQEFYRRLGCDSAKFNIAPQQVTSENAFHHGYVLGSADQLAAQLEDNESIASEISEGLAELLGDYDDKPVRRVVEEPRKRSSKKGSKKKKKQKELLITDEQEKILAEIFDDHCALDEPIEEPIDEEHEDNEESFGWNFCRFEPKRCNSLGEMPAIKLLFATQISLKQFQAIKDKLQKEANIHDVQVIGESELHFYYESISDCWRVLQRIKQRGEKGKDIIKHVKVISTEFAPGSKWKGDFDNCFSVKIQVKNIQRVNIQSILVQMIRFGKVEDVLIDASRGDYFIVRFKEQIAAENAIAHLDRAYLFGSWCRARKSQPIPKDDVKKSSKYDVIKAKWHKNAKLIRPDIFITSQPSEGHPAAHSEVISRDSWKKLLAIATDCGPHDETSGYGNICILFGDSAGVTIGFSSPEVAEECLETIHTRKIHGKSVVARPATSYVRL